MPTLPDGWRGNGQCGNGDIVDGEGGNGESVHGESVNAGEDRAYGGGDGGICASR